MGGRFRVATPRRGTPRAGVGAARAPLREVCRQWRRLLDAACTHLDVSQAAVFGDEELVGLAGVLGREVQVDPIKPR